MMSVDGNTGSSVGVTGAGIVAVSSIKGGSTTGGFMSSNVGSSSGFGKDVFDVVSAGALVEATDPSDSATCFT